MISKVRLYILLLISIITYNSYSQNISVSSFQLLNNDLTANTKGTSEVDQNGETAALIKVVTTETGFRFDCGMLGIVKTLYTPGEIWVYLPRGAQKLTIKHGQLGILRDYYFPIPIEGARTYEMKLTTGTITTIVKETRKSQYVVFQLTPSNSVVELDGVMLQTNDGIATKMVKFGEYEYKVSAPDFFPTTGKITINDPNKKTVLSVKLKSKLSKISLKVEDNAEIWINGELKGNGQWIGQLGEGTYEFEAKKQNYRSTLKTIDIVPSEETQYYQLESPIPIYGEADINSTPAMADLFIDNKNVGQTPCIIPKLLVGKHSLTITKEGYEIFEDNILIEENKPYSIVAKLTSISDMLPEEKLLFTDIPIKRKIDILDKLVVKSINKGANDSDVMNLLCKLVKDSQKDESITSSILSFMSQKRMSRDSIAVIIHKILEINPRSPAAWLKTIEFAWVDNDMQGVLSLCKQAKMHKINDVMVYYYNAIAYYRLGYLDASLTSFRTGINYINESHDSEILSDYYSVMGDILYKKGIKEEAFYAYETSLKYNSNNLGCLNNYAYYLSEDIAYIYKAEKLSYKTVEAEPHNPNYLDTYAWILYKIGNYLDARVHINQAIKYMNNKEDNSSIIEHAKKIEEKFKSTKY